jgi:oligoribonuclease (3'-5' exoribonuclease)
MVINDAAKLQQRVEDACKSIHNTYGIFERVRQTTMRRAARCMETQEKEFDNFCKLLLSEQ